MLAGSLRVLLVDDDEDACFLLGELLGRAGHDVRIAHAGLDGLTAFQQFSPEVVLLDLELPDVSGYELAKRIRALPGAARARLLALTGYVQPEGEAASVAEGFDGHLLKPIDLQTLLRRIDDLRADLTRAAPRSPT